MVIDFGIDTISTVVVTACGLIAALHGRAISAENRTLKSKIDSLEAMHTNDIHRLDESNSAIWDEIKAQRDSLAQNREAVVRLTGTIDRLNEILTQLGQSMNGKVSSEQCKFNHSNQTERRKDYVNLPEIGNNGATAHEN